MVGVEELDLFQLRLYSLTLVVRKKSFDDNEELCISNELAGIHTYFSYDF